MGPLSIGLGREVTTSQQKMTTMGPNVLIIDGQDKYRHLTLFICVLGGGSSGWLGQIEHLIKLQGRYFGGVVEFFANYVKSICLFSHKSMITSYYNLTWHSLLQAIHI